jgi:outer membrane protein OmpU
MNKFKKIGLTALAGSLVATSAFAGELTATGSASIGVSNISGSADASTGKDWSMGNSVILGGSGELDNGMTVSMSFELDSGVDTGTGTGPFDNQSVTVSSDALGTLKFSGHGGDSAQGALDTTASGDIWDQTLGITGITAAASGDDSLHYTLPEVMEGLAISASLSPGRAAQESHTAYGLVYTGYDGLTVKYGVGDSGAPGSETESTTMMASYAIGPITASVSQTEADNTGAANRTVDSFGIAYTVSDELSISYGSDTFDLAGNGVDEEVEAIGVSYTSGGMTISANQYERQDQPFDRQ